GSRPSHLLSDRRFVEHYELMDPAPKGVDGAGIHSVYGEEQMALATQLTTDTTTRAHLSVASWNVEHFGRRSTSASTKDPRDAINFLRTQSADVVAIYEVVGKELFWAITEMMPHYTFFVTEGQEMQEIMIGIRSPLTGFVTQRTEFKAGNPGLRPGVLVTVVVGDNLYPFLFLHLKSMTDPRGFGLRDYMLREALSLRKYLDAAAGGQSNHIFCGDLNTMGLDYPYSAHDIAPQDELAELSRRAGHYTKHMRLLSKNRPHTWLPNGRSTLQPLDLDDVVAASHLRFTEFDAAEVDVRGWAGSEVPLDWAERYSDHALVYFEVEVA
ncbi:MAG: endonuclease/exonuclease/phosphatase family protein, partial [Spirochaetaceae bacterium]|nr:endonuclease/exonuclease/phosphatase family protein [Spirochaetaceae bacterium]